MPLVSDSDNQNPINVLTRLYGFDQNKIPVNIKIEDLLNKILELLNNNSPSLLFKFTTTPSEVEENNGCFSTNEGQSSSELIESISISLKDTNNYDLKTLLTFIGVENNKVALRLINVSDPNKVIVLFVTGYEITDNTYITFTIDKTKTFFSSGLQNENNYNIYFDADQTLKKISELINDGDGESIFVTESQAKAISEKEPKAIHSKDMFIGDIAFVKPLSFPISNLEIEGVSQNTEVTIGSNIYPNVAYTNIGRYEKEPVTLTLPINSVVYIYVTLEGEIEFSETNTATGVPLYQVTTDESKIIEDGIVDLRPINDYDFYVGGRLVLGNDASTGNEAVRYSQMSDALAEKAEKNGDETQVFKVADGVEDDDAVNKRQLDAEKVRISDLEATQNSGASERYDTKALLEANGSDDVTKVYRVDSDTYANNGNYKYDGASYVKTSNLIDSTDNIDDADQTKVAQVSVVKKSTSLVFDNSADTPVKVRKAIKRIQLIDVNKNLNYTLGVVKKNVASDGNLWDINIYSWTGSFGASVGRFFATNYTPSEDIEVLDLKIGINVVGTVEVDWSQLDDDDSYTTMGFDIAGLNNIKIDGYFENKVNEVSEKADSNELQTYNARSFPYKANQLGANRGVIANAIIGIYLKERSSLKKYYLTSVRRNDSNLSLIAVWSKLISDGTQALEFEVRGVGDLANGEIKRYDNEEGSLVVLWDNLPDGYSKSNMFDGYELDDFVFSDINPLSPEGSEDVSQNYNEIQDPHFIFGRYILDKSENVRIGTFGGSSSLSLSDGILTSSSPQTSPKGFQIYANFSEGWADEFGLVAGNTIKIGCYVKFEFGEDATVLNWGQSNISGTLTYTPASKLLPVGDIPTEDFVWIERDVTLKTDGTDINLETNLSLAYLQISDPSANVNNTKIIIKEPCILFNPSVDATGFYETNRDIMREYDALKVKYLEAIDLISETIDTLNLNMLGSQVELSSFKSDTIKSSVRWLELKDNYDFPSTGVYLGRQNDDVVVSINGVITKLN